VLAVKVRGWHSGDEKLTAIGIGPCIRHAEKSCAAVFVLEVLVRKLGTVDAFAASAIMVCEISTLLQRVRHTMAIS
jgi:hypothetical protein